MVLDIKKVLERIVGIDGIKEQEPMKIHTSFKIGGPADFFVEPKNTEQLSEIIKFCAKHSINYFILGKGSNILVSDLGIRGIVIKVESLFSDVSWKEIDEQSVLVTAGAGISMTALARAALKESLAGLEFASGIPGTFGGGLTMNAGAYGGDMKSVVHSAKLMDKTGAIFTLTKDELAMDYRTSIIQKENYIVLEASLILHKDEKDAIKARMDEMSLQRRTKQPLEYPSAGSTFKRPVGYFAGKLIEDAGLKGYQCGGAMVSEKHSGFVINIGEATSKDVLDLIRHAQQVVKEKFDVEIEPEVHLIGEYK